MSTPITNLNEALAWVMAPRRTLELLGAPAGDFDAVRQVRDSGAVEEIPRIAQEHRRLHAVLSDGGVPKTLRDELDLYDRIDAVARQLQESGWTPIQLTANALNLTVEHAQELVDAGIYHARYGMPHAS